MAQDMQPVQSGNGRQTSSGGRSTKNDTDNERAQTADLGNENAADFQVSLASATSIAGLTAFAPAAPELSNYVAGDDPVVPNLIPPSFEPSEHLVGAQLSPYDSETKTVVTNGSVETSRLEYASPNTTPQGMGTPDLAATGGNEPTTIEPRTSTIPASNLSRPVDTAKSSTTESEQESKPKDVWSPDRDLVATILENSDVGTEALVLPETDAYGDTIQYQITDAQGTPLIDGAFEVVGNIIVVADGNILDFESGPEQTIYITATTDAGTSEPWPVAVTLTDEAEDLLLGDDGLGFTDVGVGETSITGGDGADTITGHDDGAIIDGGGGRDVLNGGNGADTIAGGGSRDFLSGGAGNDVLTGGQHHDTLDGGAGNDVLAGERGHDVLDGGTGNDVLTGGRGNDALEGGAGTDVAVFSGSWSDYTITEDAGVYTITDNRLDNPDGTDSVTDVEVLRFADGDVSPADALNDGPELSATGGQVAENDTSAVVGTVTVTDTNAGDSVTLSLDDARFEVVDGALQLRDGESLDFETDGETVSVTITATDLHGATDTQVVTVTVGDEAEAIQLGDGGVEFTDTGVAETSITGGDGSDTITGHNDGTNITGGAGDDVLAGGDGADTLNGGTGSDALSGGAGDDALSGGAGDDVIAGGDGSDRAIWDGALDDFAITYDADAGVFTITDENPSNGAEGSDTVSGVETFTFDGVDYTVADLIAVANEQANTGPGAASIAGGGSVDENASSGTVVAVLSASDADGDALTYQITDADGTPVADGLFEVVGDEIRVRDGADIDFEDGGSHDLYVTASDTYATSTPQSITVTINDTAEAIQLGDTGVEFTDTGIAETSITGGDGADTITGHIDGSNIDGGAGDDDLSGGDGNDTLTGGSGNDVLAGGEGTDVAVFSGSWSDYTINEDNGVYTITDNRPGSPDGTDSVTDVEVLRFADGDVSPADALNDGPELSATDGQVAENDTSAVVGTVTATDTNAGDSVTLSLDDARFEVVDGALQLRDGESLDFETDGETVSVTITATDFHGATDTQVVTVTVGDEAEAIQLGDGGVEFTDTGVAETSITGGDGFDTITGHSDGSNITGGAGDDVLAGGDGADTLDGGLGEDTISGGDGDDLLIAGFDLGNGDRFDGGAGNDTYSIDGSQVDHRSFDINLATGTDQFLNTYNGIENVIGGSNNDTIVGDDSANILDGSGGNDVLAGGGGDDTLSGGSGYDAVHYDGAIGDFAVSYNSGTSTFTITDLNASDGDEGSDTVTGVETFTFNGVGYTTSELIIEADRQANSGPGDVSVTIGDDVAENSSAGTVVAVLSAPDADGDALTYQITDADGAPVADGLFEVVGDEIRVRDGADIDFEDGGSHDLYVTASDAYATSTPQSITVTISDTAEAIQLGDTGVEFTDTGVAEASITGGDGSDTITGHSDGSNIDGGAGDDDLSGGDGSDTLLGGSGNDVLAGGAGNDTLQTGTGDDTIDGGADTDVVYFSGDLDEFAVAFDPSSETFTITDLNAGNGDEGGDTVSGVEWFSFNGSFYSATQLITEAENYNYVVNGSFEDTTGGTNTGDGYLFPTSNSWTAANGDTIETHNSSHGSGLAASDGSLWLDLVENNGEGNDISQSIAGLQNGEAYELSFDAADIRYAQNLTADVYFGGELIASVDPASNRAFETFSYTLTGGMGDGSNTLRFVDSSGNRHSGVSLDNIQILHTPDISGSEPRNYDIGQDESATFDGDSGSGSYSGTSSQDVIYARDGHDTLSGGESNDTIYAGSGNDSVDGGTGDDALYGGDGDDTLHGDDGHDFVHAGSGSDAVAGGVGDDELYGGFGNDTIEGGTGSDTIDGGLGDDLLVGNDGNDVFSFSVLEGTDTIDGGSGWTDIIELAGFTGDVTVSGNTISGEGWTALLDDGHSVTGETLDSIELSVDATGVITFDEGGTIDLTGIEKIGF